MIIKYISFILLSIFISSPLYAQQKSWPRKTIDGKEFYLYRVNSAEGFYSISKNFNTSQEEILQYNPEAQHGLKAGQELLIPVNPIKKQPEAPEKYFNHTVEPGETLYGLAHMYNITPEQLIALNPGCKDLLKVGFVLKIPQKKTTENNRFIYHTIEPKETLFSVARKYNTTIETIVTENPGLRQDSFSTGKVIRIPREKQVETAAIEEVQKEEIPQEEPTYITHKVKRRETLFSISKKYNISIASIVDANPGFKGLKVNSLINIPTSEIAGRKTDRQEEIAQDYTPTVDSTRMINDIYDRINSIQKKGEINVGLMLPFMLNKPNNPNAALYLEFYEGFLLAVDEMKQKGASINLYVYDTEGSKTQMSAILNKPEVKNLDLIIGPEDDALLKMASDFALKHNINIVNTFSLKNEEVLHNARIFQTNIPHPYLYAETTQQFCRLFGDRDIYIVSNRHSGQEKKEFIDALKQEIKRQSLSYKEVSIEDLQKDDNSFLMNINKASVFVPTSSDTTSLVQMIPELRNLRETKPELLISLFGYPEWQTYTTDFIDSFYALDTYIFTRFYAAPTDKSTAKFYGKFKYWYSKDLMQANPKFGILGYDTGLYFLNALYKYGRNFETRIEQTDANSIQTDFYFQRINNWGGFINKGIYFVNFRPDFTIHKTEVR